MATKIAIFYGAVFILLFFSRFVWKLVLDKFGIETIIRVLAFALPCISASVGIVQTVLYWSDKKVLKGAALSFLAICYCSYYLYRRTNGLEAQFGLTRVAPTDGNIGCLVDFLVVGCAAMFLIMQAVVPYSQLFKGILNA